MRLGSRGIVLIAMEIGLCALWGVCFVRAFRFYSDAQAEFALSKSGDAYAHFRFSQIILFCYLVSLVVGFVLVWWACYRQHVLFWFFAGCAYLIVALVVLARPEEGIVLIPSVVPLIAFLGSVALVIVAGIGRAVTRRVGE